MLACPEFIHHSLLPSEIQQFLIGKISTSLRTVYTKENISPRTQFFVITSNIREPDAINYRFSFSKKQPNYYTPDLWINGPFHPRYAPANTWLTQEGRMLFSADQYDPRVNDFCHRHQIENLQAYGIGVSAFANTLHHWYPKRRKTPLLEFISLRMDAFNLGLKSSLENAKNYPSPDTSLRLAESRSRIQGYTAAIKLFDELFNYPWPQP